MRPWESTHWKLTPEYKRTMDNSDTMGVNMRLIDEVDLKAIEVRFPRWEKLVRCSRVRLPREQLTHRIKALPLLRRKPLYLIIQKY